MNIFKTFEIFLREPLSILAGRIIQIVNLNSDFAAHSSLSAELLDGKAQITVFNNDKMYNLLKTVQYRQKVKAANNLAQALGQQSQNYLTTHAIVKIEPEKKEVVIGRLLERK